MAEEKRPLAVAFTVREKFGWALASLKRLYEYTQTPFKLYFVDCGYPAPVLRQIEDYLRDKPDVVYIRFTRFLYPGETFNAVIEQLREPHFCILQNDVLIEPGMIDRLLQTLQLLQCDIVSPLILEYAGGQRSLHREQPQSQYIAVEDGHTRVDLERVAERREGRIRIDRFENHCLMMTLKRARELYPLPRINSREHLEMSVHAWRLGCVSYRDEEAQAGFVEGPIRDYDCEFFRFRWDPQMAQRSHQYVRWKWKIRPMPEVMGFVQERNRYLEPERVIRGYADPSEPDIYRGVPLQGPN